MQVEGTENAAAEGIAAGTGETEVGLKELPATEPAATEEPPAEPAPYAPNLKYKVLKEEKEIPEWVRGSIKDAASEKTVRDLFERADGLESVKGHRDQLQGQMQEILPFATQAREALDFAAKGDLDSFFERVGIPELDILKYAHRRLELRDKPELFTAHENSRRESQRVAELQGQVSQYEQSFQQLALSTREHQLTSHLQSSEIAPAVEAFEAHNGPGSFRNEVIRRGQYYASQNLDPAPEQVVAEIVKLIGWQGQKSAPTPPPVAADPAPRVTPPTLPNFKGKGTSPAKTVARSTDDLRRIAKTLE